MKPHIRIYSGDWWICSDEQTHGFGTTPRDAWWKWYTWKRMGIHDFT